MRLEAFLGSEKTSLPGLPACPYRWVRHPLYSAGAVFAVALNLLVANWFTTASGTTALTLLLMRLPKEEEELIIRFGDEYREYAERTGRLFPRFR